MYYTIEGFPAVRLYGLSTGFYNERKLREGVTVLYNNIYFNSFDDFWQMYFHE